MTYYEYGLRAGYSNSIGTTAFILANASVVHPSGEQIRIVSDDNNDKGTDPVGTGIQKVILEYFTSSWEYKAEVITLKGTESVDTVETDIYRIEYFEAIKTGTNIFAVGTITAKSIDGSKLFAQIDPGTNDFMRLLHYVKPGWRCYLENAIISCSTTAGVEFTCIYGKDYTSIGGDVVMDSFRIAELKQDVVYMALNDILLCDATDSSRALGIAFCVKGKDVSQSASAVMVYKDFSIRDI